MPGYEQAIEQIKEKVAEKPSRRRGSLSPTERLANRLRLYGDWFFYNCSPFIT